MKSNPLNDNEFIAIIRNAPLIAIDLIVTNSSGEALLGYRKNGPAKDKWFVPGGRIRKNEKLDDAFRRISAGELNHEFKRGDAKFLNVFEHFYVNESKYSVENLDTHYVVIAYRIKDFNDFDLYENNQHSQFKWMAIEELIDKEDVHEHTKDYFRVF
jgi:colanic acid biosynthesis protein WcaH